MKKRMDLGRRTWRKHREENLSNDLLLLETRSTLHYPSWYINETLIVISPLPPTLLRPTFSSASWIRIFLHLTREQTHKSLLEYAVIVPRLLSQRSWFTRRLCYPTPNPPHDSTTQWWELGLETTWPHTHKAHSHHLFLWSSAMPAGNLKIFKPFKQTHMAFHLVC